MWPGLRIRLNPRRSRQLWYAPLLAVAMGLTMLRLLVMARLLALDAFAVYSGALLVSSSFCMVSCLGLQSLLQREWPVNLVRGQERRAVLRAAQCNLLTLVSLGLVCALAASGLAVAGLGAGVLAMGVVHGASQQGFLVATTESRSRGDALRYGWQQLLRAGLSLSLAVLAARVTGSPLMAIAVEALVSAALSAAVLQRSIRAVGLGWVRTYRLAVRLLPAVRWQSAITMMVVSVGAFAMLNADRWLASHLLAPARFAQYSLLAIVLSMAQAAQALVNASLYPLLARRFASAGPFRTFSICARASLAFLLLGALVSLPLGVLLARAVSRWYPQYTEAVGLIPLFLATGVLRIADFWSSYLLIAGQERRLLALNAATIVGAAVVWMAVTQPWKEGASSPLQVGLLALLLSLFGTLANASAAWLSRHAPSVAAA